MLLHPTRLAVAALLGVSVAASPALAARKKAPAATPAPPAPAESAAPTPGAAPGAQVAGAPQSNIVKVNPVQKDWTKVCQKDQASPKQLCYTTRDYAPEKGDWRLAFAVYDFQGAGEDTRVARILFPPAPFMLRPGFRLVVDNGQPTEGSFEICFQFGCFADAKLKPEILAALKKGKTANISVRDANNAEVTFTMPLENFGKAFDGPAIDPKVLQEQQQKVVEQQKKLQEQLQKRAEDERKKLEASKTGAAAAMPATSGTPTGK